MLGYEPLLAAAAVGLAVLTLGLSIAEYGRVGRATADPSPASPGGAVSPIPLAAFLSRLPGRQTKGETIVRQIPDWLELLAMAVGGGLSLYQALRRVQPLLRPPLAAEIDRVLDERSAGKGLPAALQALDERLDHPAVTRLVTALREALQGGSPLAEVLHSQADAARERQRRHLERQVRLLPLKLTLITVLFFVPAMLAVVLVPNILTYLSSPW